VLVDAPCSGTGVWRRNPDARWKKLGPGLEELVPLQARILKSAARLVKAGGKLVYATCSLLPDENEEQVDAFLAENPSFKRAPQESGDDVKLTPAKHGTDGFFAAVLQKV
jgi:16S rRNA (cytosine967-C5)-methyltransferase